MPAAAFRFASGATANRLVAGVPAAARLARAYATAGVSPALVLVIGEGGTPSAATHAEIQRLAPGLRIHLAKAPDGPAIPAETLPDAATIAALWAGTLPPPPPPVDPARALDAAGRAIIRATAKPGDGIVSRHLNRPLSQAASALLLRWRGVRPGHATALTAALALAMLACLLSGTPAGLVAGAVLFQLASIADGIDGEIARATHRSSARGASLDSVTDGLTNCGFLLGAGVNLVMQGRAEEGAFGLASGAIMAAGLVLLGRDALRRDGHIHFDGVKHAQARPGSPAARWLKDITSRDFYCLFLMAMTLAGWLGVALKIFLVAVTVWLIVTLRTLTRRS
jgi:CDP-L-myo-inositol myo-inositolphosphotransferase